MCGYSFLSGFSKTIVIENIQVMALFLLEHYFRFGKNVNVDSLTYTEDFSIYIFGLFLKHCNLSEM